MKFSSRLLSPLLAFLAACATPGGVMAADQNPPPKAPMTEKSPASPASTTPLVVQNPDGTLTIQKEPSKDAPKEPVAKIGLVIHPQVVVPIAAPTPEKK